MSLSHAVTVQVAFQGQKDFMQVSMLGLQGGKLRSLNHINFTVTHLNTLIDSSHTFLLLRRLVAGPRQCSSVNVAVTPLDCY